jgi:hypothetical protein
MSPAQLKPICSDKTTYTQIPYDPNREFSGANREMFPAAQGKSLAKSPADGIFGKDTDQLAELWGHERLHIYCAVKRIP